MPNIQPCINGWTYHMVGNIGTMIVGLQQLLRNILGFNVSLKSFRTFIVCDIQFWFKSPSCKVVINFTAGLNYSAIISLLHRPYQYDIRLVCIADKGLLEVADRSNRKRPR